ncbi:MAG TPA: hypothetical protein VMI54_08125 [Polyangiaceae bacterium]|nr:hypothetical protein [Polyangiaceae bacterium]
MTRPRAWPSPSSVAFAAVVVSVACEPPRPPASAPSRVSPPTRAASSPIGAVPSASSSPAGASSSGDRALAPPSAASASTADDERQAAVQVAAAWLEALADGQPPEPALDASAPELEVVVWGPTSAQPGCGDVDSARDQRSLRAVNLGVPKLVACLKDDGLLSGNIPEYAAGAWSEQPPPADRVGRRGYITAFSLAALPHPLERQRGALSEEVRQGSLVFEFFATDGGGGTTHGALVLRKVAGALEVARVFIADDFKD